MPLAAARAPIIRQKFVPFALIEAFTPNSTTSTVSALDSNTLTFVAGDLLVAVWGGSRDASVRTASPPTGNWTTPPTFVEQFDDSHTESSLASQIGMSIVAADSDETTEDITQVWSGSMFPPVVGLCRIVGGATVRQVSDLGTKNDGSTALTCTFASTPIPTSLVVALMHGRGDTLFGSAPAGWTAVFNESPSSNSRLGMSSRRGAPISQVFAGFASGSVACGKMVEFIR